MARCDTPCATASRLNASSHCSKLAPLWQAPRCASAGVAKTSATHAAIRRLKRRNGLHLDQERLADEAVDHQQGVRRIGAVRKERRKDTLAEGHELRDVLRVHHVGGELHDIAPTRAGRFERRLDVGEYLHALRIEVVRADDLALEVRGKLTRDVKEFRRLHTRDVRVLPERSPERGHVLNFDLGHSTPLAATLALRDAWAKQPSLLRVRSQTHSRPHPEEPAGALAARASRRMWYLRPSIRLVLIVAEVIGAEHIRGAHRHRRADI